MKKILSTTFCAAIYCTALFATVNNVNPSFRASNPVSIKDTTPVRSSGFRDPMSIDSIHKSSSNGGNQNIITPQVNGTNSPLNNSTATPLNSTNTNPPVNNTVPLNSPSPVNGLNGTTPPLNGTIVTPPTNGLSTTPPVK